MNNNNDKKLASDFDKHLKYVMTQLSQEVNKEDIVAGKDIAILKAKRTLMDILVDKMAEYL